MKETSGGATIIRRECQVREKPNLEQGNLRRTILAVRSKLCRWTRRAKRLDGISFPWGAGSERPLGRSIPRRKRGRARTRSMARHVSMTESAHATRREPSSARRLLGREAPRLARVRSRVGGSLARSGWLRGGGRGGGLRGGLRARRLEHLLPRHLAFLHVVHRGGGREDRRPGAARGEERGDERDRGRDERASRRARARGDVLVLALDARRLAAGARAVRGAARAARGGRGRARGAAAAEAAREAAAGRGRGVEGGGGWARRGRGAASANDTRRRGRARAPGDNPRDFARRRRGRAGRAATARAGGFERTFAPRRSQRWGGRGSPRCSCWVGRRERWRRDGECLSQQKGAPGARSRARGGCPAAARLLRASCRAGLQLIRIFRETASVTLRGLRRRRRGTRAHTPARAPTPAPPRCATPALPPLPPPRPRPRLPPR